MRDFVDDYGAVGNGTTSDNAAFLALQADWDAGMDGEVFFPRNRSRAGVATSGIYKTTLGNPLWVKNDYTDVHFELGARIQYQPTDVGNCLLLKNPSGDTLLHCKVRNVEIRQPTTPPGQLVGLSIYNTRYLHVQKFTTAGFEGSASKAISCAGRDMMLLEQLTLRADLPFEFARNFNDPNKDIDHSRIMDCEFIPNAGYNVCWQTVPGWCGRFLLIGGNQAWVKGGWRWVDDNTVPRLRSDGIRFENVRVEQIVDSDTWAIEIVPHRTKPVRDVSLSNCLLGQQSVNWKGLRLKNFDNASAINTHYRGENIGSEIEGGHMEWLCVHPPPP